MVSGGWADADANGGVGLPAGMDVAVGVAARVKVGFGVEAGVGVVLGVIVGSGVEAGVGVVLGVIVGSGVGLGVVIVGPGDGVGVDTGLTDRPQLNVRKLIRRRENARKRFFRLRPICEKSVRNALKLLHDLLHPEFQRLGASRPLSR
jgi:hypothetical protein